jgi:uncharacterized membrane protein (DUF106 family)
MKEIEEMDENHLMKLAKFMMELQERQKSMDKSDALHLAEMEGSKIELAKIQSELSKYKQPQPSIK